VKDVPVQIEPGGEPDPIAVPTALRGGTLTSWMGPFPKSLNMWLDYNNVSKQISSYMFESLVEMHSIEDRPVGDLAKSWEISPDLKTYTFHLDPAAKWSDGRPITAEDVQFYYDVMMNPKNLTSLFRVDLSRFSRPEVLDERTLRITAKQSHWSNFWTLASLVAFPKHVWKDVDFNKQNFDFPVVSGPYQMEEVKMNRSVRLKRRGDWWGRAKQYNVGKYNFDHLVFIAMEDRVKVLEALKKGDIDVYGIYTASMWVEKTNFPQVQKHWIVRQTISNQKPQAFQGFVMNMRRPLFADLKIRQAMAFLLNRELMNDKLMFNQYFLLNSYFPDLYPGYENPAIPLTKYDPEKARSLLKEAGWTVGPDGILTKNGQRFSVTILHFEPSELRHLNIYIQDLKAVGIDAKIEIVSLATFMKRADQHDYDMFWANFGANRLDDPEAMWSSKTADDLATQNYPGVKDPEIDRLIEQQKTEMDAGKRKEILKQIDARLMAISPYVLLWGPPNTKLLWWNKFGTPAHVISKYSVDEGEFDAPVYWWLDPAKVKALDAAMKSNSSLPAEPAEVHFPE